MPFRRGLFVVCRTSSARQNKISAWVLDHKGYKAFLRLHCVNVRHKTGSRKEVASPVVPGWLFAQFVRSWLFLVVPEYVQIRCGQFCGLKAFLFEINNRRQLVISVGVLQGSVAVKIHRESVTPIRHLPVKLTNPLMDVHTNAA